MWLSVATLAGVMLRLVLTYRSNVALLTVVRREAVTDALTGLGNRRALLTDLENAVRGPGQTVLAIFDLDGFKAYNDGFGHPAGDALLQRIGDKLRGAMTGGGRAYRLGGDEFCVLVPGGRERVAPLLAEADEVLHERGEGFLVTASAGAAVVPAEANRVSTALHLADTRMYHAKGRRQVSVQRQAHDVLTRLLREREPELSAHQTGVTRLAVEVGRTLGLGAEQLDLLTRAAELHDIGKIAIPDKILHKRGSLDESDWELMRTHTITGQRILAAAPALEPVAELVRSSHERWDGDGYPDGLESSQIPLGARIIFVCDAYEAMTEQRPYRRSLHPRAGDRGAQTLRRNAVRPEDRRRADRARAAPVRRRRAAVERMEADGRRLPVVAFRRSAGLAGPSAPEDLRLQRVDERRRREIEAATGIDREAGGRDRRGGVAIRVTAAADDRPDRVEQSLHPREALALGDHMLVEAQFSVRPQDAANLGQRRRLVGDRAENE